MLFDSKRKTEWDRILSWLETICLQNKASVYIDTRDLYLLIRTLLSNGFKIRYTISDIYESSREGCCKSVTDFISMDIREVTLPNILGSIRLLGSGQSKINISSQVFILEDNLIKEDGFNTDLRFEDTNKLSITSGNSSLLISLNKSDFHKIISKIPDTRAELIKEEKALFG